MLNYLSYAISATIFGLPRVTKPDVIFAYHGALPVGVPALIYKLFRGTPIVYDINDLWPETLSATGMLKNKFLLGIVERWCGFTYKYVDKITVLSKGFKSTLLGKGVPEDKLDVIYHWSRDPINDDVLEDEVLKEKLFPKDKICFLYPGTMGPAQSLKSILKAAQSLQDTNIHFTFMGAGMETENLKTFVKENQISNVSFHPRVQSTEVSQFLNSADVLMVHLKKDPLFKITIPSKTIVYMKVGKPILMGIDGDAAELVKNANAGKVCIPDDVEDIKAKVLQFSKMSKEDLKQLGKNGNVFYEKNFTIENNTCLLYTSPSPRDATLSRMPSSA